MTAKLDISFSELNNEYSQLKDQFQFLETKRNSELILLQERQSKLIVLIELSNRSSILNEQYQTDILRLRSTIEASTLLIDDNHTFQKNCPLCNHKIKTHCTEDDIFKIITSCESEIKKIQGLLNESEIQKDSF